MATLLTPLGTTHVLRLISFRGHERFSALFSYRAEFVASAAVEPGKLLGKSLTVRLQLGDGPGALPSGASAQRDFTGYVERIHALDHVGREWLYAVELMPWLGFLRYTTQCRVFQGKTVPEVIQAVCSAHGFDAIEMPPGPHRTRDCLVQYRETDLNFVERLLEQEGIYYFFRHEREQHQLILANSSAAHRPRAACASIAYHPSDANVREPHFDRWQVSHQLFTSSVGARDFNAERPSCPLSPPRVTSPQRVLGADYEWLMYPAEASTADEAGAAARTALERHECTHEQVQAEGNVRALAVGDRFTLRQPGPFREDGAFVVTSATYTLDVNTDPAGNPAPCAPVFRSSILALKAGTQYRPPLAAIKPRVAGPQTAIVTGKPGEDISIDEDGRVTVKFEWDRAPNADHTSSCRIRVAHPWAGNRFGAYFVPRVGQEVVVHFLEGDPDRPIVTGSVHNPQNPPPYGPMTRTRSGIKTLSSLDDATPSFQHYNELRFEDAQGDEHIALRAQRDLDVIVKRDEQRLIGGSQREHLMGTQRLRIGAEQEVQVAGSSALTVGRDRTVRIAGHRIVTVDQEHQVTSGKERRVTGRRETTVQEAEMLTVGQRQTQVERDEVLVVGGDQLLTVAGAQHIDVGDAIEIVAAKSLTLACGEGSITISRDGSICLRGTAITLD